ncbi:MAG TPA: adenylate/guanylate cyclase domain-containing protein [Gaiellaceae bacterium]|jgi:class 3 adenylate cyclase|nr:adenylate/guanylate cyclase domain-containing protein [Gaiellaceae bacterium]
MAEDREPEGGAELREERKVVTALFADLVGSTPLGERLEPEEVRLVGEAVARMILEIERFGGRVKDLAGDGVLAFFGAPVAYEDDAERAVRAGLRIAEEMAAYAGEVERGWGIDGFGVRIGIATGPVVLGAIGAGARVEYAAFGDTVNTAARLQTAAEPGTVLADADTRRQLEPLFEWDDEQAVELKGKTAPVAASVARRPRAEAGKRRGLGGPEVDLVGRPAELTLVSEVLEAGRAGGRLGNADLRRALAHAIDRTTVAPTLAANYVPATGGLVPPALQGHTPEIVPRFDPELARSHLERSDTRPRLVLAAPPGDVGIGEALTGCWRDILGLETELVGEVGQAGDRPADVTVSGWLPGYPDPEYYLRLLLQSDSKTNEGGFSDEVFDRLIERARQERHGRKRLELFHEADRYAVTEQVALIPLAYARSIAFVKPYVHGWWEFGKSSASFADLVIER